MKNFRTYQLAKNLVIQSKYLKLRNPLKDQLERAVLSIFLNIAEGTGKSGKDRKRFYEIAMGSLRETKACLDLVENNELIKLADQLGASLFCLIRNPGPEA